MNGARQCGWGLGVLALGLINSGRELYKGI